MDSSQLLTVLIEYKAIWILLGVMGYPFIRDFFQSLVPQTSVGLKPRKPDADAIASGNLSSFVRSEISKDDSSVSNTTPDPTKKKIAKLGKDELKRDPIAWPTVFLTFLSISTWSSSFYMYHQNIMSPLACFALSTVSIFVIFTPMHDASHHAISPKYKWLNEVMGNIASFPFMVPMSLFRFIHLMHHRYANDHDGAEDRSSLDPDHYSGVGSVYLLPLRWSIQFFHYLSFTHRHFFYNKRQIEDFRKQGHIDAQGNVTVSKEIKEDGVCLADQVSRAISEREAFLRIKDALAHYIPFVLLAYFSAFAMIGDGVLVCWLFPAQSAAILLFYTFDYVPHRPHKIPYKEDPYLSTSVTRGFYSPAELTAIMLGQNYHNIHHLYPFLPFYRYSQVWWNHEKELKQKGTRVLPLFMWPNRAKYLAELNAPDKVKTW